MKNTAINSLNYTGIVTLSQVIGKKKIKIAQVHNSGSNSLFDFLAHCLTGDFDIAALERPTKIMLLEAEQREGTEELLNVSPASGFIYLRSIPEKIYRENAAVVRYSFVIPRDMLESLDFNCLGLYSTLKSTDDYNEFAAFCYINVEKERMTSSSALLVDWELQISNSTK